MFIWEWSWGRSWIVILVKKRILVHDWKFYCTLCRSQLRRWEWTCSDWDFFAKETQQIPLTMKLTNVLAPDHLDRLLWHAEFFQVPTKERWKTFRARHIIHFSKESSKLKLYSGLSFDCQTNFWLGAFVL